jgi:hypothetical protein
MLCHSDKVEKTPIDLITVTRDGLQLMMTVEKPARTPWRLKESQRFPSGEEKAVEEEEKGEGGFKIIDSRSVTGLPLSQRLSSLTPKGPDDYQPGLREAGWVVRS